MNKPGMEQIKSIALCTLIVASLTLGGSLADARFPQDESPIYGSEKPMDDWPTERGQV